MNKLFCATRQTIAEKMDEAAVSIRQASEAMEPLLVENKVRRIFSSSGLVSYHC